MTTIMSAVSDVALEAAAWVLLGLCLWAICVAAEREERAAIRDETNRRLHRSSDPTRCVPSRAGRVPGAMGTTTTGNHASPGASCRPVPAVPGVPVAPTNSVSATSTRVTNPHGTARPARVDLGETGT